ncbi:hypothetical protein J7T55_011156 [Diaporthe amygdali]|uniref:uncharacterized protein n=1 Tax=Phomopsis amygdali TaxID=1214568 RepID=UPI0022FEED51|nr:uncharacterized protein J7T55_011156 [Diaporthe amygdali]KAJ0104372.1 hypothetical protein J7T55_011156 [Diaporthe amygdali]
MRRLRHENAAHEDEAVESSRPRKQRKQRPCYSCKECRRLKMKCDRQVPCSNCVRRNRVGFCVAAATTSTALSRPNENSRHQDDAAGASPEHDHNPSPQPVMHHGSTHQRHHELHEDHQGHQEGQPSHLEGTQASNFRQQSTERTQHIPVQANPANHNELNTLALLANALEPYAVQGPSPRTPASVPPGRVAEALFNIPTGASGSSNLARQAVDDGQQSGSHGTLMLGKRGRSKYLGPTAGSEWLKEASRLFDLKDAHRTDPIQSETQDVQDTPLMTRAPSPEHGQDSAPSQHFLSIPRSDWVSFDRLTSSHNHDVAPKGPFERTFDRVYKRAEGSSSTPINPQEIALVFIIMAQGTMFNIEMPDCDSSAEDWLHLSERALVKGNFLSNNMVAGLQTLHLMAHLQLQLDKDRRGDTAWPLWGLVMRLIQAMGMHRDGDCWNLPQDVVEERRKVFWECNSADIFQAHCFSRPSAINPDHCDTAFPSEPLKPNGEKSYSIVRFELSLISSDILNMAMKVRKPAYSDITDLDLKLALSHAVSVPSTRSGHRSISRAIPEVTGHFFSRANFSFFSASVASKLTSNNQQTNLALNISETVINLHRPYYAKALYDVDHIIIAIVTDIHNRFPAVSTRQWNFWIDAAISLFTSLLQHGARTPRYKRNLQWLLNLRTRALSKTSKVSATQEGAPQRDAESDRQSNSGEGEGHREQDEDVELLGWRTRLIERADQGRKKTIRTIPLAETPTGSQITDMAMPSASLPAVTLDSTNDILRDFWDPMLLQDVFGPPHDHPNPFMVNGATWWDHTRNNKVSVDDPS